ncbi:MAG: hypothetical protein HY097_05785 [Nitrospinae bacterium]|nr:hypothetical protein [Nitrospinota bacterium]
MAKIKAINKKAVRISKGDSPDVVAYSPIPKPDCSSIFGPGIEVHSAASSTDMNASTQGLCSPFLKDTMYCSCSWWPAHDPDVTAEETGQAWNSEIGCGGPANPTHEYKWQDLRFLYPKNGQGADAWDKSAAVNKWSQDIISDLNEIYIKDNWADNGKEPSTGNPWESPDIFIRYHDEPESNFLNPNVDYHEGNPIAFRKNFLYARVRNKGDHSIDHVLIKFYVHGLSTNPIQWQYAGHAMIRDIPGGAVKVVKSIKPWIPQKIGHTCMRVILDSTQDPVKILGTAPAFGSYDENTGPQPGDVSVKDDNNVAQRNMKTIWLIPRWFPRVIPFEINPHLIIPLPVRIKPEALLTHNIEIEAPGLPRDAFKVKFPDNLKITASEASKKMQVFKLSFRENKPVEASILLNPDAPFKMGMVHSIAIRQVWGKETVGGITLNIKVVGSPTVRFVGDVDKREVHLCFCKHVKEMKDERKIAFDSLNDARSEDYKIHEECLKEYLNF